MNTVKKMEERLQALAPENIEILDEGGKHVGHEGAKGGGGHYDLLIVSSRFAGCSSVVRHRLVYEALGDLMRNEIHALAIRALAPNEI
ncbi:MAG: BolA family transcriptional regulator [Burkholderiales bacterium]|nr:BolA family transcriptional regulator [Burkholderiales bacterium]